MEDGVSQCVTFIYSRDDTTTMNQINLAVAKASTLSIDSALLPLVLMMLAVSTVSPVAFAILGALHIAFGAIIYAITK